MVEQLATRMTAAEFLALPEEQHPIQLLEGKLIKMPPPIPNHQRVVRRLLVLLDSLIPGGEVFTSPIAVYLDEDNVPEPDVVWVAAESRCTIGATQLNGPPDLVVEVLSPGTAHAGKSPDDKVGKFALYERHGVREYWIVDPAYELLEVWTLAGEAFTRQGMYEAGDEPFASPVLGKAIDLAAVFTG